MCIASVAFMNVCPACKFEFVQVGNDSIDFGAIQRACLAAINWLYCKVGYQNPTLHPSKVLFLSPKSDQWHAN